LEGLGPMHRVSSASRTCIRSASTLEWTATVRIPSSLQARRMRRAISPRLAIRTFSSRGMSRLSDNGDHGLVELNGFAVFHQDGANGAGLVGLDLVHHLHGLDDAQHIADL